MFPLFLAAACCAPVSIFFSVYQAMPLFWVISGSVWLPSMKSAWQLQEIQMVSALVVSALLFWAPLVALLVAPEGSVVEHPSIFVWLLPLGFALVPVLVLKVRQHVTKRQTSRSLLTTIRRF